MGTQETKTTYNLILLETTEYKMVTGTLFIISAPSGAGKTSLVKQLVKELDNIQISVSHTTRQQRPGEKDGQDYFFISKQKFENMILDQAFLEHAQVFGNYYGTARQTVAANLNDGKDVILEIDWQGAQQVRSIFPKSESIFILPPSISVLEQRLRNRGQDSEEIIEKRMKAAVAEMQHFAEYDYLVINDIFEQALSDLKSIVIVQRLKVDRQQKQLADLITALLLTEKN